jgi:hypothetical protein
VVFTYLVRTFSFLKTKEEDEEEYEEGEEE